MDDWQYFIIPAVIAAICLILILIPDSVTIFAFSGVGFLAGEAWRLFTFPFVHSGTSHLMENIVTLSLTSILAYFSRLTQSEFLIVFFLSGIVVALIDAAFFPSIVIVGISLGIFALLGAISEKGTDFIPHYMVFSVLFSSIFFKYIIETVMGTSASLNQTLLHLGGFVLGIIILYILELRTQKVRILHTL